ncbi:MAG: glutamine-hydrolyzing GMP synthase [Candidatus Bipolaricaulaceae bacterium]
MSVAVLDFGSQYTLLIARRLRELGARSVVLPGQAPLAEVLAERPQAVILSGGPGSVLEPEAPQPHPGLFSSGLPMLGICYGMQLIAHHLGGQVQRGGAEEYGKAVLEWCRGPLFAGAGSKPQVWMSHADTVSVPPPGWQVAAATADCPVVAIAAPDGRSFGLQFHPEVAHTPQGGVIMRNFLTLAGVDLNWTPTQVLDTLAAEVEARAGGRRVLLAVSGGVDSSALALLLARAGVDHLAVFVDHGLLRAGEREEVEAALRPVGVNLHVVDASDQFLAALRGVTDPEEKRRRIGRQFVRTFEEVADRRGPFHLLAQGTLYPDVIESAGAGGAAVIKSHHNVGGLPEALQFELLEPFRYLFKDEVRELASLLGLPENIRRRHPFPGPGLAVRVVGEVTADRVAILRQADAIFSGALRECGLYDEVWQAFCVLLPSRSVGVTGDARRYGYVVALRAVTSVDGMTGDWARLPADFLDQVAGRIVRRIPAVGRVVYDITSKPPATIEWE